MDDLARQLGSRGGRKTLEKYGKKHFKEASKKGLLARQKKKEERAKDAE